MPVQRCRTKGRPAYRWGNSGKCYTYTAGNEASRKRAKQRAYIQGSAIEASQPARRTAGKKRRGKRRHR